MVTRVPNTTAKVIRVFMLGGLRIQVGEDVITDEVNRSLKLWSVLCYLIIHRNRSVPQSELIDVFWPDENSANPLSALKVLLHRARSILEPLFDEDLPPIISRRGAYQWNPAIACELDADRFEELCVMAGRPETPAQRQRELYQAATELYKGDFLPKLNNQTWVVPLTTRYHNLYIAAVKTYAVLLEDVGQDLQMELLCARAIELEPLDEALHVRMIRAMMHQGNGAAALKHCEAFTERLYHDLGLRPSDELKNLQKKISADEERIETDLDVIHDSLKEAAGSIRGAFVCDYDIFKAAYQLEARRALRSGACLHMGLITVTMPDGEKPPQKALNAVMEQLLDVIVQSLRQGDVVTKYSSAQFAIMLPFANLEDSTMVMERILSVFRRQYRRSILQLSYKLRELSLT